MNAYIIYSFRDEDRLLSALDRNEQKNLCYLKPGKYRLFWKKYADNMIKNSDCVICMVTHNFIYSYNIKWEIDIAKKYGKRIYYYKIDKEASISQEIMGNMIELKSLNRIGAQIENKHKEYLLKSLFNNDIPGFLVNNYEKDKIFEQYKIMVTSSNELSNRRHSSNKLYLAMNGAILSAAALASRQVKSLSEIDDGIMLFYVFLSIIGVFVNDVWSKQVRSYRQLSSGKFKIINMLEEYLNVAIFTTEWKALSNGKDEKIYASFTKNEVRIPKRLKWTYIFIMLMNIIVLIGGLYVR